MLPRNVNLWKLNLLLLLYYYPIGRSACIDSIGKYKMLFYDSFNYCSGIDIDI